MLIQIYIFHIFQMIMYFIHHLLILLYPNLNHLFYKKNKLKINDYKLVKNIHNVLNLMLLTL